MVSLTIVGVLTTYPSQNNNQDNHQEAGNPYNYILIENKQEAIKALLPYIRKEDTVQCGSFINEEAQWKKTLQCASKVFTEEEMDLLENSPTPDCFVIKEESPGVFKSLYSNYLAVLSPQGGGIFGAVLGLFDSKTQVMFLVQNYDLDRTYRHEAQHYIFSKLNREKEDTGITAHSHEIWKRCEPPYYFPSEKAKDFYKDRKLSKEDIVMDNLMKYSHARVSSSLMSLF